MEQHLLCCARGCRNIRARPIHQPAAFVLLTSNMASSWAFSLSVVCFNVAVKIYVNSSNLWTFLDLNDNPNKMQYKLFHGVFKFRKSSDYLFSDMKI